MAVEIALDLRLSRPGEETASQRQTEDLLAVVIPQEIDDEIPQQYADHARGDRIGPPHLAMPREHGSEDDRHFLGDWQPEPTEDQDERDARVTKLLDQLLGQGRSLPGDRTSSVHPTLARTLNDEGRR